MTILFLLVNVWVSGVALPAQAAPLIQRVEAPTLAVSQITPAEATSVSPFLRLVGEQSAGP